MPQPFSFIGEGTYTNGASLVPVTVALSDQPDWFFVKDLTNWGAQSTAANPIYAEWFSNMAAGAFLALGQPSSTGSGVTTYASQGTSNGFTFVNSTSPPTFASLTATSINASTLVVSMTNTGSISVGDYVRIINPVGMLQLGGATAQVTAVSTNTSITLGYLASAVSAGLSLGSNASSASIMKFFPSKYYPRAKIVSFITQATQAVVYFASTHDFTVGEVVDFSIPTQYGMTQLSFLSRGVPPTVVAVTNSATVSSITINVNTTGFTAFLYPTSANVATGNSPPICVPAGSGVVPNQSPPGTNLLDAFDNHNQYYMNIGTSACGIANANMQWFAFKADYSALSNA